jgi:hypothetical protein
VQNSKIQRFKYQSPLPETFLSKSHSLHVLKSTVLWKGKPYNSETAQILEEHIASTLRVEEQGKKETSRRKQQAELSLSPGSA